MITNRSIHRKLILVIDIIGQTDYQKLKGIHMEYLDAMNKEYLGYGRILFRTIKENSRIYVFDCYALEHLSPIQKIHHYFFRFRATALRYIGIKPRVVVVTFYA